MWWCSANSATAIADFITMVPGNQQLLDTLQNSFYHVQYFNLNENNNQGGIDYLKSNPTLAVSNGFTDNFYDDEGWWALAWIAAYDINSDGEFLNAATDIFQAMTGGWDNVCNGGLWWRQNPKTYKNAISNELFLNIAAALANRASNKDYYLNWAKAEWDWFQQSGMINGQNLINDGLTDSCQNNGPTTWTYNQGVILGAL